MPDSPPPLTSGLLPSIRVGVVVGLIVALGSLFVPNQYISEARILPAESRSAGSAAAAAAVIGLGLSSQEGPDATYVDILNSRSIRETLLLTRYRYHERAWFFGQEHEQLRTLQEHLRERNLDRAVKKMAEVVSISRDLKTKQISLAVETTSPELSQLVTRNMLRLLDEFVVSKAQTKGSIKAGFTSKRLSEARQEMAVAEETFRLFLDSNRNYLSSPDPAVRLKGLRLDNELKLRVQLVTTLALSHEQALLEQKNDMPILNVLDPGNLPIEKSRPSRTLAVIFAIILGGLVTWIWIHRHRILGRMRATMISLNQPLQE